MVSPRPALALVTSFMLLSCSSGTKSVSLDEVRAVADALPDSAPVRDTGDVGPQPDVTAGAVLRIWYDGFSQPLEDEPAIYIVPGMINGPNLVTFFVRARHLGLLAGAAFYLQYDPALLRFDNGKSSLDLGDSGPYFTTSVLKEMVPGSVSFGVARFCKDKIPWGSTDQCGGGEVNEDIEVASFTFELITPGTGSLGFPKAHALLLRPDRTSVEARWIGGSFLLEDLEVAP